MRTIIGYIALAVAVMLTGAAPANATWTCDGPAYVCGSPASAKASKSKVSYKKSNKSTETASYDKPSKKAKKSYDTASDDKPAKKAKKSYSASNDSDGGSSYSGKASYYWEPQALASGGRFNPNALTAAHKTLPFGTKVRVTNRSNGRSVVVTINDRGPYVGGRIIDLSRAAAQSISMTGAGVAPVTVTVLGKG
jgi:rare lipoprotein A